MSNVIYNAENRISQKFKKQTSGGHGGIDIGQCDKYNTEQNTIYPLTSGTILMAVDGKSNDTKATGNASYGNFYKIDHGNGVYCIYAHLQKGIYKKVGDKVTKNDALGIAGDSGRAFGRHLHFEVRKGGDSSIQRVDPEPYLTMNMEENTTKETPIENIPSNNKNIDDFKVGDSVIVNGRGYASSYGTGAKTGNYNNRRMKIIMKVKEVPYPLALNQYDQNNGVTGWFRLEDVEKV